MNKRREPYELPDGVPIPKRYLEDPPPKRRHRVKGFGFAALVRNWLMWNRPAIPRDAVAVAVPTQYVRRVKKTLGISIQSIWSLEMYGNKIYKPGDLITLVELDRRPKHRNDIAVIRIYVLRPEDTGGRKTITRSWRKIHIDKPHWLDEFLVEDNSARFEKKIKNRRKLKMIR